ncbi:MAG: HAMP domain-containing sensor histidine kinase [Patescibacteria group bacterium]|nr:HAMP domain-containing sensor histidine kinase [Patescibacteria group bacterium]
MKTTKTTPSELTNLEEIKRNFITIASHQLRTPISAIRWSLDTLLDGKNGKLTVSQREVIKDAYQNNNYMARVVTELLKVSRIEQDGVELRPQVVNFVAIVKKVIKQNKDLAKALNCGIEFSVPQSNFKINIDPLQIESVVNALLFNSLSYSRGHGKIKISLKKDNEFIIFKIEDNGIGISLSEQARVFTKFFRGKNALKVQTEGLGLDLYLANKVIKASGGKINFTTRENRGTTFTVYLPLKPNNSESKVPEEPQDILKKEREFVSLTVHELKAPLGVSRWSLELLKSEKPGKLTPEQRELIDHIYRGNERLLILVNDLLNLAKLQQGTFEIDLKKINLVDLISEAISTFKLQAESKNITISLAGSTTKFIAKADPNRMLQVFSNLLSNAIKYTQVNGKIDVLLTKKTGSELLKISSRSKTAGISNVNNSQGYVVVSVKDNGMGISEADQKKMFSRFFRSRNVLKSKIEGTGLGLFITKSILNLHQGDIWFDSQLKKGSTFNFSLPLAK